MKRNAEEELQNDRNPAEFYASIIDEIMKEDQIESLQKLISDRGIEILDSLNAISIPAVHLAAKVGAIKCLKHLVEMQGVDILSKRDEYYNIPIEYAAENGQVELIEYFINNGVSQGELAITTAARRGHIEVIECLINNRIDVAKDGNEGMFQAVLNGHIEIVKLLHKQGISLDIKHDEDPYDPLVMYAVCDDQIKVLEYLNDQGVNLDARNADGKNAMDIAVMKGKIKMIEFLHQSGGCEISPYLSRISKIDTTAASYLQNWAEVDKLIRDIISLTPLKNNIPVDFKNVDSDSLVKLTKTLLNKFLNVGVPDYYKDNLERACQILPKYLQEKVLSHTDSLIHQSTELIEIVEGILRARFAELSPTPYSLLLKDSNKELNDEQIKLKSFYEDHPEYKTPGNYLGYLIDNNSQLDIPLLNQVILESEDLLERVKNLNKSVLPIALKQKLATALKNHECYKDDIALKNQIELQYKVNGLESKVENLQTENTHLKEQMSKMMLFMSKMEGFNEFMASAEHMNDNHDHVIEVIGEI